MQPGGWAWPARLLVGGRAGGRRKFLPAVLAGRLGSGGMGLDPSGRQAGRLASEATPSGRSYPVGSRGARSPGAGRADAGRRTAGSERAGGGADCHAGFANALVPTGPARTPPVTRRWAGRSGPGTGTGSSSIAVRNGALVSRDCEPVASLNSNCVKNRNGCCKLNAGWWISG